MEDIIKYLENNEFFLNQVMSDDEPVIEDAVAGLLWVTLQHNTILKTLVKGATGEQPSA